MRAALAAVSLAPLFLVACAVAEYPYPVAWEPIVPPPSDSCERLAGRYADRGERDDEPSKPSLTRELFGEFSDWEKATAVELALPRDKVLEITVSGSAGRLFSRTLDESDFSCRGGRLVVKSRRFILGYIMSGRQHIELELNHGPEQLITQVEELAYGMMFVVFPVVGTARHWYRFRRL